MIAFVILLFISGQGAFSVAGKVESGSIQNHDRILVMPAGENGVIKGRSSIPYDVFNNKFRGYCGLIGVQNDVIGNFKQLV